VGNIVDSWPLGVRAGGAGIAYARARAIKRDKQTATVDGAQDYSNISDVTLIVLNASANIVLNATHKNTVEYQGCTFKAEKHRQNREDIRQGQKSCCFDGKEGGASMECRDRMRKRAPGDDMQIYYIMKPNYDCYFT
jgi:hypothetical protein